METLEAALIRLGNRRAAQSGARVRPCTRRCSDPRSSRSLWERLRCCAIAVAHLSRLIGARAKAESAETAYLCGLMHDVGIAGALLVLAPAYGSIDPATLWPALGMVHDRVGTALVQLWGLPQEVAGVVAVHHKVDEAPTTAPLVAVLRIAEKARPSAWGPPCFRPAAPRSSTSRLPTKEGLAQARRTLALQDKRCDGDRSRCRRDAARARPRKPARSWREQVAKHPPAKGRPPGT